MSNKSAMIRLEKLHRLAVNAWKRSASEREFCENLESNVSKSKRAARSEKTIRRRTSYYLSAINADLVALSRLDFSIKLVTPMPIEPACTNAPRQIEALLPLSTEPSISYAESGSSCSKPIQIPQQPVRNRQDISQEERTAKFFIGSPPKNSTSTSSMEDVMLRPLLAPMKISTSSGGSVGDLNEIDDSEFTRSLEIELEQQRSRLVSFLRHHSMVLMETLADLDKYDVPNWKLLILSEVSSELARAEFLLKEQVDMLSEYMAVYSPNFNKSLNVNSDPCTLIRLLGDQFVVAVRYIRRMFCML